MASVKTYLQDTYDELKHKVTWPTWSELQNSSIVVLIAAVIIALIIYLMDVAFSGVMKVLYQQVFG